MNKGKFSRIEQFNQFKKEIRGSTEHLIIGIDVAKDKHHAFMGSATGKSLLRRVIFENSISGFSKLLTQTEAIKARTLYSTPYLDLSLQATIISLWQSI